MGDKVFTLDLVTDQNRDGWAYGLPNCARIEGMHGNLVIKAEFGFSRIDDKVEGYINGGNSYGEGRITGNANLSGNFLVYPDGKIDITRAENRRSGFFLPPPLFWGMGEVEVPDNSETVIGNALASVYEELIESITEGRAKLSEFKGQVDAKKAEKATEEQAKREQLQAEHSVALAKRMEVDEAYIVNTLFPNEHPVNLATFLKGKNEEQLKHIRDTLRAAMA